MSLPDNAPRPRLCHLIQWPDFKGYGFNLHAEKNKQAQYIGKVDDDSPAKLAGLREGDKIIEVNFVNISNENHRQVVERIKSITNETKLLVIDDIGDKWYRERKIVIKSSQPNVIFYRTPIPRPEPGTLPVELSPNDPLIQQQRNLIFNGNKILFDQQKSSDKSGLIRSSSSSSSSTTNNNNQIGSRTESPISLNTTTSSVADSNIEISSISTTTTASNNEITITPTSSDDNVLVNDIVSLKNNIKNNNNNNNNDDDEKDVKNVDNNDDLPKTTTTTNNVSNNFEMPKTTMKTVDQSNNGKMNGSASSSSNSSLKSENYNGTEKTGSGELNLNMTAAEMRRLISQRKKQDVKSVNIDLKTKYEIIQQM